MSFQFLPLIEKIYFLRVKSELLINSIGLLRVLFEDLMKMNNSMIPPRIPSTIDGTREFWNTSTRRAATPDHGDSFNLRYIFYSYET